MTMQLSLSVRVAESFTNKRVSTLPFSQLAQAAREANYDALCMRASVVSIESDPERRQEVLQEIQNVELEVSMVTGDFAVPENSESGPACLRNISPYLDLCEELNCKLIRVCIKNEEDIRAAQRAADEAAERQIRLAHQSHTQSLFETVPGSLDMLNRIGRSNFGLIYEPANLALCGQEYGLEILQRLQPYLFNVYLQNHVPVAGGSLIMKTWTRGDVPSELLKFTDPSGIDIAGIMGWLKSIEYSGFVTLHHTQLDVVSPLEAATESAAFLKGCM